MDDVIWRISSSDENAENIEWHLQGDARQTVKIGGAPTMDVRVPGAAPCHATLSVEREQFLIRAHKKMLCCYGETEQMITRGEEIKLQLSELVECNISCELRIKGASVVNSFCKESEDAPGNRLEGEALQRRLGKFELQAQLGRGAAGVVHRAFDTELKRHVALKVLTYSQMAGEDDIARFTREAKAASSLDHPNIITVYEAGTDRGYHYIAMQLVEGENLQTRQEQNPLSAREGLILVRDVARALQRAHEKGIIHRDVKPSNIMIDGQGKPYLMDFGLAKDTHADRTLTKSGEVVGTLIYMAPEILDGYPPTPLQDVYSLGVILYELLTGQRLVEGSSSVEILEKILEVEPAIRKIRPKIAGDAETICLKALEKKPDRRYPGAREFADDIDRFLDYRPIMARPPGIFYRIYKKLVRHKAVATVTAASLSILLALSLYSFVLRPAGEKKSRLLKARAEALERYRDFHTQYRDLLDRIPKKPDPAGMSEESLDAEKKALVKLRAAKREKYRIALNSEVLPLCRRAWHLGQKRQDFERLQKLLQEIIALCETEEERRPFRIESLRLQGAGVEELDVPAPVVVDIHPQQGQAYLFKLVESGDGRLRPMPFDFKSGETIPLSAKENFSLRGREEFLRCQNLLWEAACKMLSNDFSRARWALLRCLELNPDYPDANFLLCCLENLAGKPEKSEKIRKVAAKRMQSSKLCPKKKSLLLSRFDRKFVKQVSAVYEMLHGYREKRDYLLRLTSLPAGKCSLEIGDYILKVAGVPITTEHDLSVALTGDKPTSCLLLRDFSPLQVLVSPRYCKDPKFQVMEDPPIIFIWDNKPLDFAPRFSVYCLKRDKRNQIENKLRLAPGDYLLYWAAPSYFPIRYPFRIRRDVGSGKPAGKHISLTVLRYPKGCEKLFRDFALVLNESNRVYFGVEGSAAKQNTRGFMIGRYEVTFGDWLAYLRAVNGVGPWNPARLREKIPMIMANRPMIHFRAGKLVLRLGKESWPVFGVSQTQIENYLHWRNSNLPALLKSKGFAFRLPTEQEWCAAARGADDRKYPWGNSPNPKFCKLLAARKYRVYQEPIAKYNPAFLCDESPFGVNDMGGGLSEYTSTGKFSGSNRLFAVKGSGWSDSRLADIDRFWYSSAIVFRVSRGFRLCAGLDPLFSEDTRERKR